MIQIVFDEVVRAHVLEHPNDPRLAQLVELIPLVKFGMDPQALGKIGAIMADFAKTTNGHTALILNYPMEEEDGSNGPSHASN